MSAKEVLALIRERVRTGQLPSGPGDKTYGSKGSNTACACCGRKIASHEIEYEVHFDSSPHAFSTHFYCYQIWWREWSADEARGESERRWVYARRGGTALAPRNTRIDATGPSSISLERTDSASLNTNNNI